MYKRKEVERNQMFYQRMKDLGYQDVTSFAKESGIDISFETIRRAINDNSQDIRYEYIVVLMQALDFTPLEIAKELKARGDRHLHLLVSRSAKGIILNNQEKLVIRQMRKDPGFGTILVRMTRHWPKPEKKMLENSTVSE